MSPRVAVYRDYWLNRSETFVLAQQDLLPDITFGYFAWSAGNPWPANSCFAAADPRWQYGVAHLRWRLLRTSPLLEKALAAFKPSIIHAHFGADALQIAKTADVLGIPLIVSHHGSDVLIHDEFRRGWMSRSFARHRVDLWNQAVAVVVPSRFLKHRLLAQGCPEDRVHVIEHPAPSLNKYTPYEDRDIDVLYVGRMTENKGPDILLDALLHPEIKSLNIRSCFVGDGPLLEGLNRLAAGTSGIQFVGPQAHAKVLELMDRSRIVVVPSRSLPDGRSEGFGLAAIEGAAAGCRVLVARTGALTETIDASDDDAFEPNPESLAAILKVNLANPTTASERAEMVRKAVCSNLSRGVIGSKWDALYGISTAN